MTNSAPDDDKEQFLKSASHDLQRSLFGEFVGFMRENKVWWMTPILVVLALVGVLLAAGSSAVSAFLYSLF